MRRLSRCAIEPAESAGGKKPPRRKKNYVLRFWKGDYWPHTYPFALSPPRPVGSLQLCSPLVVSSLNFLWPLVVEPVLLDSPVPWSSRRNMYGLQRKVVCARTSISNGIRQLVTRSMRSNWLSLPIRSSPAPRHRLEVHVL
jgi:hypothetical protein